MRLAQQRTRPVVGLEVEHPPHRLQQHMAHSRVTVFVDAALLAFAPAGGFARTQPGVAGYRLPVGESRVVDELSVQHRGGQRPESHW